MAWMSRTLLSTFVKSVSSRSSATAASRLFVACLSNWVKKKLFFGSSERRMAFPPLGTQRARRETLAMLLPLRDFASNGRDGADRHHETEGDEDADVAQDERIGELVALDHDRPQRLVGVRQREDRGERSQVVGQLVDRDKEPREEDLRQQDDRHELNGLQLVASRRGDEQSERDRADDEHRLDDEDRCKGTAVVHLQDEDGEEQDHDRLQQCEEAEAREIAKHELCSAEWRSHEPLERPRRTFAEERHGRQQEDEEEREERDEHRREIVEDRVVGSTVELIDLHRWAAAEQDAGPRERVGQRFLDRASDGAALERIGALDLDM